MLKAATRASGASRYVVDGFPLVASDGFPFVHDQAFELEARVGAISAVVHLDASLETCASRSRGASPEDVADAMESFRLRSLPVIDFFRSTSGVITVDANAPVEDMHAELVGELDRLARAKQSAASRLAKAQADEAAIKSMIASYGVSRSDVAAAEERLAELCSGGDDVAFDDMVARLEGWGITLDPAEHMVKPDGCDEWSSARVSALQWYDFYFCALKTAREAEAAAKAAAEAEAEAAAKAAADEEEKEGEGEGDDA